jgi:hypothetical protein
MYLRVSEPRGTVRLTNALPLGKVAQGRVHGPFFGLGLLGGRTIGSTSDSGSDYPGSSPGLPAKSTQRIVGSNLVSGNCPGL